MVPIGRFHMIKEEHTGHIEADRRVNHQMNLEMYEMQMFVAR